MEKLRSYIKNYGKRVQLTKGEMIIQIEEQPTHLYLVESGWVKIGQEEVNGEAITLSLRKRGDLFGISEILARHTIRSRAASCLTNVSLLMLSIEQFHTLLEEEPAVWEELGRMMADRVLETQQVIRILTTLTAPQRLGWFLQQFAEQQGDVYIAELPLTHEEISYLVRCSRQKLTSYLNKWRNEGAITYERGRITIVQSERVFPVV